MPRPPIATATVNRRLATIKSMFTKADDWTMLNEFTCKQVHRVKLSKESVSLDRFLSMGEISTLFNVLDDQVVTKTGKTFKQ